MSEAIYFSTSEIRMSAGKFRTSRRYIRAKSPGLFAIAKQRTIDVVWDGAGGLFWRYSVNGYVREAGIGSSSFNAWNQPITL